MRQITLPFCNTEKSLRSFLENITGKKVSLVITDNSSSMLSVKSCEGSVKVRLHWMFLSADSDVLKEIGDFIKKRRAETPFIDRYIKDNSASVKNGRPRKIKIKTQGRVRDLMKVFYQINNTYFNGRVGSRITWGARGPKRSARNRTLGSYCTGSDLIRVNPILDSRGVPIYFLQYVVYHEMLHADMEHSGNKRKRSVHCKDFKRREKLFEDYDRAIAWEKKRWQ